MDIYSISNLLEALAQQENEVLKASGINHRPTIGNMYEGLTADIVNKSLFKGLNLTVARNSFIAGSQTEYDIILAEGAGVPVRYSEHQFTFEPKQVLAVIQVKKNLYGAEVKDSYENLATVVPLYYGKEGEDYMCQMATTAIRNALGKHVSAYQKGMFSIDEEYLYHTLVTEPLMPVRIVIGYNGYASEYNFRKGIIDYLNTCKSTASERREGYGPNNIPNLIICSGYSCVKLTGNPFSALYDATRDGWWDLLGTSHFNPMYFLLEVLWCKLAYKYELPPEIFGEDLETPVLSPFIEAKIHVEKESPIGWDYNFHEISEESLKKNNEIEHWKPVEIDRAQQVVISVIGRNGFVDVENDKDLEEFVIKNGYKDIDDFVKGLLSTRLVTLDGSKLKFLTYQCECVTFGGKWYAADNNTGRLTNWVSRELAKLQKGE